MSGQTKQRQFKQNAADKMEKALAGESALKTLNLAHTG